MWMKWTKRASSIKGSTVTTCQHISWSTKLSWKSQKGTNLGFLTSHGGISSQTVADICPSSSRLPPVLLLDQALVSKLWSTSPGTVIKAWIVNCNLNDILINCIYFVWAMQAHPNRDRLSVHFPLTACLITDHKAYVTAWVWTQFIPSQLKLKAVKFAGLLWVLYSVASSLWLCLQPNFNLSHKAQWFPNCSVNSM